MILSRLKLHNIRSYLDAEIDFPEGSMLLAGDIGSGKSTVLLAIDFALFGIQRGNLSGASLLRHGKSSGYAELDFKVSDMQMTIRRTLKRTKTGVTQDSGTINIGGSERELTPIEMRKFIVDILGYPEDALTKSRSLIYRYTVYTPQEQMQQILLGKEEDRLDIMRRIFGIDKYRRVKENTGILAKELRSRTRELKAKVSELSVKKEQRQQQSEAVKDMEKNTKEASNALKSAQAKAGAKKEELQKYQKLIEELNEKKQRFSALKASFVAGKDNIENAKQRVANNDKEAEALSEKLLQFKGLKKPAKTGDEIKAEIDETERRNTELNKRLAVLRKEADNLSNIYDKGKCNTCGQPVHNPKDFKSRVESKQKELSELDKEVQSNAARLRNLRELLEEVYKYDKKAEEKRYLDENLKRLAGEKKAMQEELKKLVKENSVAERKAKAIVVEVRKSEAVEKEFKQKQDEAEQLRTTVLVKTRELAKLEEQTKNGKQKLVELDVEIKRMREDEKTKEKHLKLERWLSSYFSPLMDTIEKHVMFGVHRGFNDLFTKWFNMLIPDENLKVRVDARFSPVIEQNGFETSYEYLSGGEKTAVALAYRLALNKVINTLIDTIKTRDLIILDEPTDGFSMEQMDSVRDVLRELANKQTIIVSHEPKIDSFVDSTIRLSKEGHVTKLLL